MNGIIYNDQLSKLNKTELLDLLIELKGWYIDYKDKLEINDNKLTFGVEIEFEQARYNEIKSKVYDINVGNNTLNMWELKIDQTVRSINILKENCGGEINSPIMRNTTEQWNQLKNVCEMLKLNGATAENKAGAHIHFGSQILGTDNQNWINLVKLWILYEKIIYRFSYGERLKERLRDVYYGGLPASILLFINQMCNGKSYDRSMLITMSMDDFQLVNGDIKDLELRFGKESADHSWAESNGWVYDTSLELKIEKKLYNAIHEPQTNKINSKEACYAYQEYQEILNSDLEKDKYMLPLILPLIEPIADKEIFSDFVKSEIARFKEQINYDALCKEIGEDMIAKGFSKKKNTSVRQT